MDDTQKQVVAVEEQTNEDKDFSLYQEFLYEQKADEEPETVADAEEESEHEGELNDEADEEDEVSEAADEETESETEEDAIQETVKEKPKEKAYQTPAENSRYKAARKEAESRLQEAETQLNAIYAKAGVNGFDELMKGIPDDTVRKELEKSGITSEKAVEEALDKNFFKQFRLREEAKIAQESVDKARKEHIGADIGEFKESYPTINVEQLLKDESFALFGKGKLGKQTLREVYEDYTMLTSRATQLGAKSYARKEERSTSSSKGGAATILSSGQKRRLDEWNANNPANPMTEEEFLKL